MPDSVSPQQTIDRIAPTRRPLDRVDMRQDWSELLFLHWTVPVAALRPHIPPELEIDTFEGNAYIGLVPFTMSGVRPIWSPSIPGLSNFHETNVRTYVHYKGRNPGVWFFSLDAANAIAVQIALTFWKLPYYFATMTLHKQKKADGAIEVDYETERLWPQPTPGFCKVRYSVDTPVAHAKPGTLEHFLAERYFLYTKADSTLYSGQVYHTPYPLQKATVLSLDENLIRAAGIIRPETPPLAHYASGVRVEVFPLRAVKG